MAFVDRFQKNNIEYLIHDSRIGIYELDYSRMSEKDFDEIAVGAYQFIHVTHADGLDLDQWYKLETEYRKNGEIEKRFVLITEEEIINLIIRKEGTSHATYDVEIVELNQGGASSITITPVDIEIDIDHEDFELELSEEDMRDIIRNKYDIIILNIYGTKAMFSKAFEETDDELFFINYQFIIGDKQLYLLEFTISSNLRLQTDVISGGSQEMIYATDEDILAMFNQSGSNVIEGENWITDPNYSVQDNNLITQGLDINNNAINF